MGAVVEPRPAVRALSVTVEDLVRPTPGVRPEFLGLGGTTALAGDGGGTLEAAEGGGGDEGKRTGLILMLSGSSVALSGLVARPLAPPFAPREDLGGLTTLTWRFGRKLLRRA